MSWIGFLAGLLVGGIIIVWAFAVKAFIDDMRRDKGWREYLTDKRAKQ